MTDIVITAVAAQPRILHPREIVNCPMIFWRVAIIITTIITGADIIPLITAVQNSA